MVSEVQQKILNSSSSSSSILGNLLNSSDISSTKPSSDPYSTWTLPRTNRVLKRTLSLKSNKSGTVESIASTLNNLDSSNDLQRSELDKITGWRNIFHSHLLHLTSLYQYSPFRSMNNNYSTSHIAFNMYNHFFYPIWYSVADVFIVLNQISLLTLCIPGSLKPFTSNNLCSTLHLCCKHCWPSVALPQLQQTRPITNK